jgi:hypothetical protein
MSLLAKQGWRLTQFPNLLVAKIFKEKYYPNDWFMETLIGKKNLLMHGGVYGMRGHCCKKTWCRKLVMGSLFPFGMIGGCQWS